MVTHLLSVTEQVQVIRARLELNQKAVARLKAMLPMRHDFYFQATAGGGPTPPPQVLHEFHDSFDQVMQCVTRDKEAQIRADEKTLADVRGEK